MTTSLHTLAILRRLGLVLLLALGELIQGLLIGVQHRLTELLAELPLLGKQASRYPPPVR